MIERLPELDRTRLTSMHDVVLMTILQRTPDLTRELARGAFPESAVLNDVVQHRAPLDVLEHEIEMGVLKDHFSHAAYVRVMEEHVDGRFADRSEFPSEVPPSDGIPSGR